eukprot:GDKJ01049548.1.p1 GENE.GDKJ01049548.1~~GDKJ01049548.1.p1  ORF type:complete len:232 (-),score=90.35 GDKJ01049548.1:818-1477(-)
MNIGKKDEKGNRPIVVSNDNHVQVSMAVLAITAVAADVFNNLNKLSNVELWESTARNSSDPHSSSNPIHVPISASASFSNNPPSNINVNMNPQIPPHYQHHNMQSSSHHHDAMQQQNYASGGYNNYNSNASNPYGVSQHHHQHHHYNNPNQNSNPSSNYNSSVHAVVGDSSSSSSLIQTNFMSSSFNVSSSNSSNPYGRGTNPFSPPVDPSYQQQQQQH